MAKSSNHTCWTTLNSYMQHWVQRRTQQSHPPSFKNVSHLDGQCPNHQLIWELGEEGCSTSPPKSVQLRKKCLVPTCPSLLNCGPLTHFALQSYWIKYVNWGGSRDWKSLLSSSLARVIILIDKVLSCLLSLMRHESLFYGSIASTGGGQRVLSPHSCQ